MKLDVPSSLGNLPLGELDLPEDAIVLVRYLAPDDDTPGFAWTSTTHDTALKIGLLTMMRNRLWDVSRAQFEQDDD